MSRYPHRIVCLTEETTETLYLLGAQDRIVGISGYTVRPPEARRDKPKVSAFTSAKIDKILDLEPDLVLGFSDLQADIAAALIRAGIQVHVFNQRSVSGILDMILLLGALVGKAEAAGRLCAALGERIESVRKESLAVAYKPRVYFEEWDDPIISGIPWVSELVEIAGAVNCFPELNKVGCGKGRIIADPGEVVRRSPDVIVGSWCGKRFRPEILQARPGWDAIPAIRNGHVHEIKSAEILQPGPAALTDGLTRLRTFIRAWTEQTGA